MMGIQLKRILLAARPASRRWTTHSRMATDLLQHPHPLPAGSLRAIHRWYVTTMHLRFAPPDNGLAPAFPRGRTKHMSCADL